MAVVPEPSVMLLMNVSVPKTEQAILGLNVNPVSQVAPVQSTLLPKRGISATTAVDVLNASSMYTSSCGRGTREVQLAAVDQEPPSAFCQCWSAAVVKAASPRAFMVLPPQLPEPRAAALMSQVAAPAPVMSWKSALEMLMAAAVMVRAVPTMLENTSTRLVAVALLLTVKVPEQVTSPPKLNWSVLEGDVGVTDKFLPMKPLEHVPAPPPA